MKEFIKKVKAVKEVLILGSILMALISGGSAFIWASILSPKIDTKINTRLEPIQEQLNILINIEKFKVMEKYSGDRDRYERFCKEIEAAKQ